MEVEIKMGDDVFVLTDEDVTAINGVPVLMNAAGEAFGPRDVVIKSPYAEVLAGFVATYARDDHPDNPEVLAMVEKFVASKHTQ